MECPLQQNNNSSLSISLPDKMNFWSFSIHRCQKEAVHFSYSIPSHLLLRPLWRPHMIKDILQLENIQRREIKFIMFIM